MRRFYLACLLALLCPKVLLAQYDTTPKSNTANSNSNYSDVWNRHNDIMQIKMLLNESSDFFSTQVQSIASLYTRHPEQALFLKTIKYLAISQQILDPRETQYTFTGTSAYTDLDFYKDLRLMRNRYHELKDAPYVEEANKFPPRNELVELRRFNRTYFKKLELDEVMLIYMQPLVRQMIRHTNALYKFWDAVHDARTEFFYITVRRHALKKIAEIYADLPNATDGYFVADGNYPPNVPTWFFSELK